MGGGGTEPRKAPRGERPLASRLKVQVSQRGLEVSLWALLAETQRVNGQAKEGQQEGGAGWLAGIKADISCPCLLSPEKQQDLFCAGEGERKMGKGSKLHSAEGSVRVCVCVGIPQPPR